MARLGAAVAGLAVLACGTAAAEDRRSLRGGDVVNASRLTASGAGPFNCLTSLDFGMVSQNGQKGMALDDTTFEFCTDEIPETWPNTNEKITSMRIFKPWGVQAPTIFSTNRKAAWANLKAYAKRNGVRFLVGTGVGCNKAGDEEEWELTKEFMQDVGAENIMGLAIGNELELLWQKSSEFQNPECLNGLFAEGGYEKIFNARVAEMDTWPGFSGMPVTAVLGMYVMAGTPFVQEEKAGINTFLTNVWETHGNRFVFTFNLYPYFDPQVSCSQGSIDAATGFTEGIVPGSARAVRQRMAMIGAGDAKLWVGETGWSTPMSNSVAASVANCAEFSSEATFQQFYKNFLAWDMGNARVDHAFYFTIHDSKNFNAVEHFGLIGKCGAVDCKLR